MKNNTKLIMENWRKFLKEGPDEEENYTGLDDDGLPHEDSDLVDEKPEDLPPPVDSDLEGDDPYYHGDMGSDELADVGLKRNPFANDPGESGYGPNYLDEPGDSDVETDQEWIDQYSKRDALDGQGPDDFDERYGLPDDDADDYDGEPPF